MCKQFPSTHSVSRALPAAPAAAAAMDTWSELLLPACLVAVVWDTCEAKCQRVVLREVAVSLAHLCSNLQGKDDLSYLCIRNKTF